ncbi:hypothetical protein Tco_0069016 [Tanacetum coccineum]
MESNKLIHRSDEQKNLYKALVDAYESDKLILDTYGDTRPTKLPSPDHDWNKTLPNAHGPVQPWLCLSLVELEYLFEEVYKATTDQLDWNNPKGQQYPHDLRKLLPLIPNFGGRHVIPFDHFINNDIECLSGGVSS